MSDPAAELKKKYRRTVAAKSFSAAGVREADEEANNAQPSTDQPQLNGSSATVRLRRVGSTTVGGQRFRIDEALGVGTTGEVYSVFDRNLERLVAVKVLRRTLVDNEDELKAFVNEARLTASLSHPNVLPVHEFDVTHDGQPYFSMSRIAGESLGSILEKSTLDFRHAVVGNFNALVGIMIGVGNALAYAHHQGVVHQDVKPDNIMVGEFGEVLLLDWGSAVRAGLDGTVTNRIYGTPLYMSPEQARRDHVDARSDVYCLGATFFHALTLRLPVWDDDPDRFWEMKRDGEIQPPTEEEQEKIPAQLLGIALKAMAPSPENRYSSAKEFIADLKDWQAGLAVSAYRDSIGVRLRRWHRRNAKIIWPAAIIAGMAIGFSLYLHAERLKELAEWGAPIVTETFSDDSWQSRWTPMDPGTFATQDGKLVTKGERASFLVYNKRLSGSVAMEFDGVMPLDTRPCDLSAVWCEGNVFETAGPKFNGRTYFLQTGARDNIVAMILEPKDARQLSLKRLHLVPGQSYHIRVVIDGLHMELQVDGQTLCSYDDVFPFTSGYLALYGYYPGKLFDNVRIYNRGVPQKISVLAIGDSLYQMGLFDAAMTHYQRVIDSHGGTELADAALFRIGLCQLVQGRWSQARASWEGVRDPALKLQVQIHDMDHLFDTRTFTELANSFSDAYEHHPELRSDLRSHWRSWVKDLNFDPPESLLPLLQLEDGHFPAEEDSVTSTFNILDRLGRWDEAAKRFGQDPQVGPWALLALDRYEEMNKNFADYPLSPCTAQIERGEYDLALPASRQYDWMRKELLLSTGRFEEYASEFGTDPKLLVMTGRAQEAFELPNPLPNFSVENGERAIALMQLGKREAALAYAEGHPKDSWSDDDRARVLVYLGRGAEAVPLARELQARHVATTGAALDAAIAGDLELAHRRAQDAARVPLSLSFPHGWFEHYVVLPALDSGKLTDVAPALAAVVKSGRYEHHQRPWYFARLVAGEASDEEYLKQPFLPDAKGTLLLGHALRHDLANETEAALADYRAYLALPMDQRGVDAVNGLGDPLMERFCIWRLAVLAPAPAPAPPPAP